MSICFQAYFAIGETFRGVDWLRDELAHEPGAVHDVVERWRHVFGMDEWSMEPAPLSGLPLIRGRGGFSLTVGRRAVELHHMMTFGAFTYDADARAQMRAACLIVARRAAANSPAAMRNKIAAVTVGTDIRECHTSARWIPRVGSAWDRRGSEPSRFVARVRHRRRETRTTRVDFEYRKELRDA